MTENVTQKSITDADIQDAERLEMNPELMMRLVDLIFLCKDEHQDIPS